MSSHTHDLGTPARRAFAHLKSTLAFHALSTAATLAATAGTSLWGAIPLGRLAAKAATVLALGLAGSGAWANLITNGSFEIADPNGTTPLPMLGWTTMGYPTPTLPEYFQQQPGTTSCAGMHASPTDGHFAAISTPCVSAAAQPVRGASLLQQSFMVPLGATSLQLSFDMFRDSFAPVAFTSGDLNPNTGLPKLYSRVDLMQDPSTYYGSNPFSIAFADIAIPVLAPGADAGPSNNAYTSYSFSFAVGTGSGQLLAGQTYALRFAEVHTLDRYVMGVDNVVLTASTVPEPGSLALAGLALVATGAATRRRGRGATGSAPAGHDLAGHVLAAAEG